MRRLTITIVVGATLIATMGARTFVARLVTPVLNTPPGSGRGWDRWSTLTHGERRSLVAWYQDISRRPDGERVFANCRTFGALSAKDQDRLRRLHQLVEQTVRSQRAPQRLRLLKLLPPARAHSILRILETQQPETLTEFLSVRDRNE